MLQSVAHHRTVAVRAPAKLNLFLELLSRREDGYHEIETVMVPINCYDTLIIRATTDNQIRIRTDWHPNREVWVDSLGGVQAAELLDIPDDDRNLIYRAIAAVMSLRHSSDSKNVTAASNFCHCESGAISGFDVIVRKRTPAGAGMGGASSDAAAAMRAAADLLNIPINDERLWRIAAQVGSDVPFFLGAQSVGNRTAATLATGRGERLSDVPLRGTLKFIVAYPATALSTALVYRQSVIPHDPVLATPIMVSLSQGDISGIGKAMFNRLSDPALKISPMVSDLLEQMWRCGLPRCQLTGSGSACFSLLDKSSDLNRYISRLRLACRAIDLPVHIMRAHSISIPQRLRSLKSD